MPGLLHLRLKPDLDQLIRIATALRKHGRCTFVLDPYVLGDLGKHLEAKGYDVVRLAAAGNQKAAGMAYSLISRHNVSHQGDDW